ncbi:hypothetical protein BSKO_06896 [Bryopsis sp. KO-2023]|nr:hypothetical protein BSKO_06896 [Bryopsis sp. KO-2023]
MDRFEQVVKGDDSVVISGVGKAAEAKVAVIGDGCFAQGLCNIVEQSFAYERFEVAMGSIKVSKGERKFVPGLEHIPIAPVAEALEGATLVVLAIPAASHFAFVQTNHKLLHNKVIVDVSNPSPDEVARITQGHDFQKDGFAGKLSISSVAERLQELLEGMNTHVVKAFNNISAYRMLETETVPSAPFFTTAAADNAQALQDVEVFAKAIGIHVMRSFPLAHANKLEKYQFSLFPTWILPTLFMFALFGPLLVFALIRYNVKKGYKWDNLPLQVTNKAMCWLGLWGLALTFLPGALVGVIQCMRRTKDVKLPRFLKAWLDGRKPLGLLSAFCILIHVLMSMVILSKVYYKKFYDPETLKMNWRGEVAMLFGILGASLLVATSIGSLPSVSREFKFREWRFVFSSLPWLSLGLGLAHVLVIGIPKNGWTDHSKWPGDLPSITILSSVLPMTAIFMKLVHISVSTLMKHAGASWKAGDIAVYTFHTDLLF